ncbi:hypothetical protein QQZ08_010482 [Neonectria magnoliae]|uniref:Uncharacterized protein n=1 Tax=Neonectria magnoliae TaxID=2732573 RepID=A0ABR1HGH6_9HYPO
MSEPDGTAAASGDRQIPSFHRENGAALVKKSSSKKKEVNGTMIPTYVVLICDRGGNRPSVSAGLRHSTTQKTDCPFKITAKASQKSN